MSIASKFLKKISESEEHYNSGDVLEIDGNARGVNPRLFKAKVISVSKSWSTHGNPGEYVYKVKNLDNGNIVNVDHFQVQRKIS